MIYFFSDLDNTLVYSHRVTLPGECVAVEYLNNRNQSYMTKKTFDFFTESSNVFLVPTTTRTCEQYARLSETFIKFGCKYALVCNGGILLENNKIDAKWIGETKAIAGKELHSLIEAERVFHQLFPKHLIHSANEIMIYAKTDTPKFDASKLKTLLDTNALNIFFDSRKVYCIPLSINKGNAVKRFSEQMGIKYYISAGDSLPDVSMLNSSNEAIMPFEMSEIVENKHKTVANKTQIFSDFICDSLSKRLLSD